MNLKIAPPELPLGGGSIEKRRRNHERNTEKTPPRRGGYYGVKGEGEGLYFLHGLPLRFRSRCLFWQPSTQKSALFGCGCELATRCRGCQPSAMFFVVRRSPPPAFFCCVAFFNIHIFIFNRRDRARHWRIEVAKKKRRFAAHGPLFQHTKSAEIVTEIQ